MGYEIGHLSSTAGGRCIICGKSTGTYLTISKHQHNSYKQLRASINIPVCDGEHYMLIKNQKEMLISQVKAINKSLKFLSFKGESSIV